MPIYLSEIEKLNSDFEKLRDDEDLMDYLEKVGVEKEKFFKYARLASFVLPMHLHSKICKNIEEENL